MACHIVKPGSEKIAAIEKVVYNIKKKFCGREDTNSCCLGARQERYALRYHACLISGVNSHINTCLDMNWLPH